MQQPEPNQNTQSPLPLHKLILAGSFVLSIVGYLYFAFFLDRTQPVPLMSVYFGLFLVFILQLSLSRQNHWFTFLFYSAIIFRAIFLFSEPLLSDDVYRFLWDGRLSAHGINPFAYTPAELMYDIQPFTVPVSNELFQLVNSPDYHTIYPPICQAIFLLAGIVFPKSIFSGIVLIRLFIFAAEIRSLVLIKRLLKLENKPSNLLFLYALNPLIIIELTGNLHFEALMLMFILEAVWRFKNESYHKSAIFFGLSVSTKLLPLIFMPLFLRRLKIKPLTLFYAIVGAVTVIFLIPLLSTAFVDGFSESFSLYFQKFEFNASVYYIARFIGFQIKGWNTIAFNGKLMAVLTFISIFAYSLLRGRKDSDLFINLLWVWFLYLVFALTVHPWYVTPLILFCLFTPYRFPILWSFLAFVTYTGYTADGYEEPLGLIAIEYLAVYAMALFEVIYYWKKSKRTDSITDSEHTG